MKIAILGSGDVARSLGAGLRRKGHDVMLGTSNPAKLAGWTGSAAGVRSGSFAEAAAFGEVVMVSVPYRSLPDVGKDLGDLIKGKVVIDTCNPFPGRDGEIAEWARKKGAGLASAERKMDS